MENNSYLVHSAKGTTWAKGNHKYLWKEKKNGRTYYFYRSSDKNYGYDGMSTKGYLSAIDDAYSQLVDTKNELGDGKRDAAIKKEVNKDMMKVAKDRRRYIEENNYLKIKNEAANLIMKGIRFMKSIRNKQRESAGNYDKLISKYKEYLKK